jgi:hypothetical protein
MLISRGPTYQDSGTAGLRSNDTAVLAAFREAPDIETFFAEIEDHMEEWHDGCDCKVVPVFKHEAWFGEDAAKQALEAWKDATKVADVLQRLNPTKRSGPEKGRLLTKNEIAINALRSMLEDGEVAMSGFAAFAA